ncbi:anion permease [Bacteroidota bacterium]|nr:anion permease [Bacteroidota bacterium]
MNEVIHSYDLIQWILVMLAAFLIGMGKAGLKGVDMLNVTLMAIVFGGKTSTGIVLPLLCVADIAAVAYYNRHAQWKYFWKLVPWMMAGILLGVFAGKEMDERLFKKIIAAIILVTIVVVFVMEYRKSKEVPDNLFFTIPTGLAAGFTTMMGNLAGAFANLYFLAMRLGKNDFIGTGAWIFLFMNLFKLPFQIFYWKNIDTETIQVDLLLIPALAAGFWAGLKIVQKINDVQFRKLIIVLTLIGAVLMLLR